LMYAFRRKHGHLLLAAGSASRAMTPGDWLGIPRTTGGGWGGQKTPPFAGAKRRGRDREEANTKEEEKPPGLPSPSFFLKNRKDCAFCGTDVHIYGQPLFPDFTPWPPNYLVEFEVS